MPEAEVSLDRLDYCINYPFFRFTSRKVAIKDRHLIAFVLGANSVNALILFVYIIYEGVTTGYDVTIEPNVERLSSIDGVSYS